MSAAPRGTLERGQPSLIKPLALPSEHFSSTLVLMINKILVLALVGAASVSAQVLNDGDDGSYHPEKYEVPYQNEVANGPAQRQYSAAQPPYPAAQRQYPAAQPQYPAAVQPQVPAYRPQAAQLVSNHKNAAILSEARYLNGDGKFGSSYSQDDGVEFKEESDPDGTRRGTYSYVDPSGQRRTVSYTAGKNGFQASGDHLPQPVPVQPAPVSPQYTPSVPQYRAPSVQPQYRQPEQAYGAPSSRYSQPEPQYRGSVPQYSQPQNSQPQYSQPQNSQPQYSQPQYSQPQYSQPQYSQQQHSSRQSAPPAGAPLPDSAGGYTINALF